VAVANPNVGLRSPQHRYLSASTPEQRRDALRDALLSGRPGTWPPLVRTAYSRAATVEERADAVIVDAMSAVLGSADMAAAQVEVAARRITRAMGDLPGPAVAAWHATLSALVSRSAAARALHVAVTAPPSPAAPSPASASPTAVSTAAGGGRTSAAATPLEAGIQRAYLAARDGAGRRAVLTGALPDLTPSTARALAEFVTAHAAADADRADAQALLLFAEAISPAYAAGATPVAIANFGARAKYEWITAVRRLTASRPAQRPALNALVYALTICSDVTD
jgi:hypothetical protein